jgi:hypothetical protein
MADIPQALATYNALVGVALGAGLTYGLGALNRRHQEKREDATRWYEARLDAYRELSRVMTNASRLNHFGGVQKKLQVMEDMALALGPIHLVGSPEVIEAAEGLVAAVTKVQAEDHGERPVQAVVLALRNYKIVARKDLGHPKTQVRVRA